MRYTQRLRRRLRLRHRLEHTAEQAQRKLDWLRRTRGTRILYCLGDSHVKMFQRLETGKCFERLVLRCTIVGGATALGLVNPNSKTDALKRFRQELGYVSTRDHLLFLLGEVDCGFVIWYRANKYNMPVEAQFERSLANYQSYLLSVADQGYRNIIVCSVPLPTIVDGQTWGEVADARKEVAATLAQRTELTLRYNARMRHFCGQEGLALLDFEQDILDQESGVVRRRFLNHDPLDHHLEPSAMTPVLVSRLQDLGFH